MPDASDYDSMGRVAPFLDSFIDTCCDITTTTSITSALTLYVDIVVFLYRQNEAPCCGEQKCLQL